MPTPEARRARLGHLYELLAGSDTVAEFAADLARVAADHMDVRVSCGLIAQLEGRTVAIASSDDLAKQLDAVQDATGEGPCIEAIRTGQTVDVTDPAVVDWRAWRDAALDQGLRQALSVPLIARSETLGAVNLYSTSSTPFTSDDREAAQTFAIHATGSLMVATRLAQLAELGGHLESALHSRAIIDQAKGVIIAENHCTADEAFEILRRASQNRNLKLRELAVQIVTSASRRAERPDTTSNLSPSP